MIAFPERFHLEPLAAEHAVNAFYCEQEELTTYLQTEALSDVNRFVANVFVKIDQTRPVTENVAGFFALRAHALRIDESYFDNWEMRDDAAASHPELIEVPLVELMWFARDARWRGAGLGDLLMFDVVRTVAQVSEALGFIGLYLRATPGSIAFYQSHGFQPFREHPHYDNHFIMPTRTLRQIAREIDRE